MINFRELSVEDKYNEVIRFIKENNHPPRYNAEDSLERKMYVFVINKKNILERGKRGVEKKKLTKWEKNQLEKITKVKENTDSKLKKSLKFCEEFRRLPRYASSTEMEKNIAKKLNSVKLSAKNKNLTQEQMEIFKKIMKYKKDRQRTKAVKLSKVMLFCKKNGRTPRQHVNEENEKRLAEFLSTMKLLNKEGSLNIGEKEFLKKILLYAPIPKGDISNEMLDELLDYARKTENIPRNKNNVPIKNRKKVLLYYKMKKLEASGDLNPKEKDVLNEVRKLCGIKSRIEKLKELHEYVRRNNQIPKEKQMLTRYRNFKTKHKGKKLTNEESKLFDEILSYRSKKV